MVSMDESWNYIGQARMLAEKENYIVAFYAYLKAFDRNPDFKRPYENEFCSVLFRLNTVLAESNKIDVIFSNFERALKMFPDSAKLLNEIGKYLYKYGYYKEALDHFEKVLKITPSFVEAEKNLNSIKNLLVERWHYRMLNDNIRNESYRQAIHQAVLSSEEKVLDVGTGTGLLAIYAHEASASKIVGCDGSEVMCNLADNIVRGHKIKNIKIINKMSTDLTLWDLGGKCSLLLTEMFDAGLFGEHVLQMLSHAWPALLSKDATVIPNTAEFFVVGVQSDHLSKNYQLCCEAKSLLNISTLNVHVQSDESYDCEDVHLIKDIIYLTEPQSVLKINLNDLKDITETLERTEPYKVELKAKENGQMNIVIGWFNLYLSDLITVTTNPKAIDRANAWQQAVFFDDIPKTLQENNMVQLEFLMNGGKLTMVPSSNSPIIRASAEIIKFLNDLEYMKMITDFISIACVYLGQIAEMSDITVVDLCPFPLFGLLMLKRGAKSLLCCATNEHDKDFIVQVFSDNQVSMANVTILFGNDWTQEVFGVEKYHAIFTHMLEMDGDVSIRLRGIAARLKTVHLQRGGLYLPAHVKIIGQLVSSHWLDLNNRLYDDNVSNYKMAEQINKYKVTQNFHIDFSVLKYVPISEPAVLCNLSNPFRQNYAKMVQVVSDGYANAILCWYNIKLMQGAQEISTNRPNNFTDGMLFLTYSKQQLVAGKKVKIISQTEADSSFKLVMEPL